MSSVVAPEMMSSEPAAPAEMGKRRLSTVWQILIFLRG